MKSILLSWWRISLIPMFGVLLINTTTLAQGSAADLLSADSELNLLANGGFEITKPAYWEPSGDGAVWSTEYARTPEYSLALGGSGEASWMQLEAVRNWVPGIPGSGTPEIVIGFWVYTDGVNTSPASDDEKFQAIFNFYADDTQSENVLGEPIILDVPQDAASSGGWVKVTSEALGAITFPSEQAAKSATIEFRKGANTSGSVYFDDVFMVKADPAADGWTGGYFNANMDAGDTWYYWWSGFDSGADDWPEMQAHIVTVTNADAYQGSRSLRLESGPVFNPSSETVGISERVAIDDSDPIVVSFRVKHEGNAAEDSIGIGQNNLGITALWYDNLEAGAAGYGEIGGVDLILNGEFNSQLIPLLKNSASGKADGADWTQYAFVLYPLEGAVGVELRPRYWHGFSGVTYWDDIFVTPLSTLLEAYDEMNLLTNGDFEAEKPAYWESSGDGATWNRELSRTPETSLQLSGAAEASWTQTEAVRNWVPGIPGGGNPELVVGGWVYTEGVNTGPASDDEKFQLVFDFFTDETQTENVLGESIVIDLPQTEENSNGWVRISSESLGAITFPGEQAAKSATVTFRKGASATGTAYLDDIFLVKADPAADGWPGGYFNSNMDAGDTWYYWWSGFDSGAPAWPDSQAHVVTVTNADASEGSYSLRIEEGPITNPSAEAVGVSERVPVTPGVPHLMSFKVRHDGNVEEDSVGIGQNNLGLTVLWYENTTGGSAGYGEIGGADIVLNGEFNSQFIPLLKTGSTGKTDGIDWTQYAFVTYPLDGAIATEIRPRYWHGFTGVSYWDEMKIIPLGSLTIGTAVEDDVVDRAIPERFQLHQNYPNPFNPATTIAFDLQKQSEVTLTVYNVMGQQVATLLSGQVLGAGTQRVEFQASELPSGTYLYVLEVDDTAVAHKMVLLK